MRAKCQRCGMAIAAVPPPALLTSGAQHQAEPCKEPQPHGWRAGVQQWVQRLSCNSGCGGAQRWRGLGTGKVWQRPRRVLAQELLTAEA